MAKTISILSVSTLSSLGADGTAVWQSYLNPETNIHDMEMGGQAVSVAALSENLKHEVEALKHSEHKYIHLDDSVLYAILASRKAIEQAGWGNDSTFGINIGSSRGATGLFENNHSEFISTGKTNVHTSPATTLGNISSWVAHDLNSSGPDISHSITCSTSLHAILNGIAWLNAGMADKFLAGGSEAPLTPFTIAQMKAMKIYSSGGDEYPNRAGDLSKTKNTLVLGEGAGITCIEVGKAENALAYISGYGYATELLSHGVSLSAEAECLQKSMKMAIGDTPLHEIDAIVMHAPGTIKGDNAEFTAIQKIFGANLPQLTTNKWKTGHTFGTSGILSVELGVLMLQHQTFYWPALFR
ncbi:beta-ketoacyl synthase N-terminal-like domain-containing protein [Flavobacterium sp. J372]|uniref:beta-ketoacyl synthase N-terminal-like domain-containing protein n=1 Tax=Flavobacterium sp. J372 TaxID=2898436 RepID=UPI0027E37E66|nr:beta-ketoacyl synthase N-terminal-like domain-containing protein [Flavobacterium sp. J372]